MSWRDAPDSLFAALQNGDSAFPSGGFAYSWGIEKLWADGKLERETIPSFILQELEQRWANFDRVALVAAYRSSGNHQPLMALDWDVEARLLCGGLRKGSRQAGRSLLAIHKSLGTAGAKAYSQRVSAGDAPGHLPIVQGLLWAAGGHSEPTAEVLSAYGFVTNLATASIRLGIIGHLDAQRILTLAATTMPRLLEARVGPPYDFASFSPLSEIAIMRHERSDARLFSN